MYVIIIGSKICYGTTKVSMGVYTTNVWNNNPLKFNGCMPANYNAAVKMSNAQFERFKNAGRRHASSTPGKKAGNVDRTRPDRTGEPDLFKWDVAEYGELTGRTGPWGDGSWTNRDHMTANSSNQIMLNQGQWPGWGTTASQVKAEALAITVSGKHHREASYTYGGRTKKKDTPDGSTRMQFGASHPTESFLTETQEMLEWKSNHIGSAGLAKNTLRVEMVGAYAFMYKKAVDFDLISATVAHDQVLMHYLGLAIQNDDGQVRQF